MQCNPNEAGWTARTPRAVQPACPETWCTVVGVPGDMVVVQVGRVLGAHRGTGPGPWPPLYPTVPLPGPTVPLPGPHCTTTRPHCTTTRAPTVPLPGPHCTTVWATFPLFGPYFHCSGHISQIWPYFPEFGHISQIWPYFPIFGRIWL